MKCGKTSKENNFENLHVVEQDKQDAGKLHYKIFIRIVTVLITLIN
jgi:hypothetical protein